MIKKKAELGRPSDCELSLPLYCPEEELKRLLEWKRELEKLSDKIRGGDKLE